MTAAQLKAAILDLAIHGKLVPQDLSEEPAGELVKRIMAERSSRGEGKNRRSSRVMLPLTKEDIPFAVPAGWTWIRLGDMVLSPITYGIIKLGSEDPNGVKVLRSSDVKPGRVIKDNIRTVTPALSEAYSRTILHGGEVVVNVRGTLGGCAYISEEFAGYNVAREVAVINRSVQIDGQYLMWCLVSDYFWRYLGKNLKGIAYKGLNIALLVQFPVPLPSLAEQKRIVAKIDELMPLVERYADAEGRRTKLDENLPAALLKSVLKSAFDGELTPDCDFEDRVLDDVCADVFTGNSLSDEEKKKFTRADGLPFIGTKDVGFDQVIDYENGIRIPASESRYRTAPSGATLLCVEGGSSGRKIGLVDHDVRFGNKLCAFVPGSDLEAKYLFLYLQSPQFLDRFSALQNGPRKGAGVKQVKALTITMTDKGTQKQIVQNVERLLLHVGRVGVRAS